MFMTDVSPDQRFREICRDNGWRRTSQRRAVFDYLRGNRDHPTVEMVWQSVKRTLPDVSLDSIYRILDAYASAGVIQRLDADRVIRYDADSGPHDHFVCSVCGRMFDFRFMDVERVAEACRDLGSVAAVELCVRGVCRQCRLGESSATAAS